jgi:soluble lytic murein transglycosylase
MLTVLGAATVLVFVAASARTQTPATPAKKSETKQAAKSTARKKTADAAPAAGTDALEKQLALFSRALRDRSNATTYAALAAFATRNAKNETGARAALALGYYDLTRDKPDLALGWLRKAVGDKLLREYVLYWQAQASFELGQKEAAVEQFQSFRRDFPDSALTEQAVTSLAQAALAIGKGEGALAALNAYPATASKPALLLLRAQANEKVAAAKGEKPAAAAADYLDLYYHFPLNDEAKIAGQRIPAMQSALGEVFPGVPMQTQIARAEAFYDANRWLEASAEFVSLLPKLSGVDHERADLRIVQCEVEAGGRLEQLSEISLSDPDLDAERLYSLEQANRAQKNEAQMLDAVEQLAKKYPQSSWTADALFGAGNYYWVNLDRAHAAEFYRRSLDAAPDGRNAQSAAWRLAWIAYLDRKPEAADMLEAYVRQYPSSNYVPDALYWLGRSYERSGNLGPARSFYLAAANRFPLTYFGEKAAERIRPEPEGLGVSPVNISESIGAIPPAPPLPALDPPLDPPASDAADEREARARALTDIAFDSSAELEYRAAYAAMHAPRYLIDAANSAIAARRYGAGMAEIRQVFPQLEARRISDVPNEAWRAAFPLPYEPNLRTAATRNQLDPMLVAGLIRQESAFEPKAMSHAGAVGLMQVMPKTALKLARQMRVRYRRAELTDPGYNLQLGSRYLANLIQSFGTVEAALAAYNAGEDHVMEWTAGQNYLETPEFVESIPFTETREYVQIVIRNAEVYRRVYAPAPVPQTQQMRLSLNVAEKTGGARPAASREARPAASGESH